MILSYTYITADELNRREARERQSEASREMLFAMLADAGIPEREIARDEKGRPYLVGRRDVDFNISHSENIAVCVLSVGEGRVGVDVERSKPLNEAHLARFARRFFAPDEGVDASTVISAWTEKEAYLKYLGVGIATDLKSVRPKDDDGVRLEHLTVDGYSVTVCLDKNATLGEARRFSPGKGSPKGEG